MTAFKRFLIVIGFGVLGVVFVLVAQDLVPSVWNHGENQFEPGGEDAAGHHLKALMIGGPLFFAIFGWIGAVTFQSWRRGVLMVAGVLLAALLCFGLPNLHGPAAGIFDYYGSVPGLVGWWLASVVFAVLGEKAAGRVWK